MTSDLPTPEEVQARWDEQRKDALLREALTALRRRLIKCEVCGKPAVAQEWSEESRRWWYVCDLGRDRAKDHVVLFSANDHAAEEVALIARMEQELGEAAGGTK